MISETPPQPWTLEAVVSKLEELAAIEMPQFRGDARHVYEWLCDNIRYIPDSRNLDRFQGPVLTLARRAGDCEDITLLAIAMTRGPAIARIYGIDGVPKHVAAIIDGVPIDAALKPGPGMEFAGFDSILDVELR